MPAYRSVQSESKFTAINSHLSEKEFASFAASPVSAAGAIRPFKKIDFGSPLSVVIRRVHTGHYPEPGMFSHQKPMLITSVVRDISTTVAGSRALNLLKRSVVPNSKFSGPDAAEDGTQLVYYSPAVASPFITISLTMIFQNFNTDLFGKAKTLFSNLAGVPIFMPAAGYLLGASTVVKIAGEIGAQLLNGRPVLSENIQLDFGFGGGGIPQEGFWVLSSGSFDVANYHFDPVKGLLDNGTGQEYDGPDPVIVVSIDGGSVEGVSNFSPLLASAGVLGRFFNQEDGSEVAMDAALDAVKLLNDLTYRKKADDIKTRLEAAPENSPEREKLQSILKTFNDNIGESRLKLSA